MNILIVDHPYDVPLMVELCRRAGQDASTRHRLAETDVVFVGHRHAGPAGWTGPVVHLACSCHGASGLSLDIKTCTPGDIQELARCLAPAFVSQQAAA
ncbi:MAG: hypothetical protein GY913_05505 [Proteobacteria bacterium]|nr:hypothetical protein [Pseudomonadota bacterium]MCP4916359.1 hypothetical protein [Pseudomonadota bacterium]